MVCTVHGKHSHFCIGLAQSIHCVMMQLTRAVGHCHMPPIPTNTRLLNPPIEHDVVYPVHTVTKKIVFLPTEPTIWGGFLLSLRLTLLLSTLSFQVRRHCPTLQSCAELCWPPNCRWLVTVLPQGNVELHFHLFFAAFFNGGWRGLYGKVVEIDDSCFSRQKCNCGRLCATVWVFVGVEQKLGTPVLSLSLIPPLRHCHH